MEQRRKGKLELMCVLIEWMSVAQLVVRIDCINVSSERRMRSMHTSYFASIGFVGRVSFQNGMMTAFLPFSDDNHNEVDVAETRIMGPHAAVVWGNHKVLQHRGKGRNNPPFHEDGSDL